MPTKLKKPWPKFIKGHIAVAQFDSEYACGIWHYKDGQKAVTDNQFNWYLGKPPYKPITRAEASAILGRDV